MRLRDRVAIITAGTSDTGADLTRAFVREGAKVLIVDTDVRAGQVLKAELGDQARFLAEDLSACSMADRVLAAAQDAFGGRIDLLANVESGCALGLPDPTWPGVGPKVGRGLWSAFRLMRACQPALAVAQGSIINFASAASASGLTSGRDGIVTGEGVWAITREAARTWRADGIRVNVAVAAPVPVEYLQNKPAAPVGLDGGPLAAIENDDETPMSELARIALFLASDASIGLTGMMLTPDGFATSLS